MAPARWTTKSAITHWKDALPSKSDQFPCYLMEQTQLRSGSTATACSPEERKSAAAPRSGYHVLNLIKPAIREGLLMVTQGSLTGTVGKAQATDKCLWRALRLLNNEQSQSLRIKPAISHPPHLEGKGWLTLKRTQHCSKRFSVSLT